jgi:hypothetical protein
MPRYSDTSGATDAACPSTGPLVVYTICPTVHLGRQAEVATNGMTSKRRDDKCLMVNIEGCNCHFKGKGCGEYLGWMLSILECPQGQRQRSHFIIEISIACR